MTSARPPQLSLVIPTYNERDRLETLVDQIFAACTARRVDAELVIVDDNSPDRTGDLADELATRFPITVIHRAGKLGLGSAVLEGFQRATGDHVGVLDADLSHPPRLIPVLYEALISSGVDIVVGSRYVDGGGAADWPFSRQVLSHVACWLAWPLTPVRDPMSGFFMMRRDVANRLRTSVVGFKIGLELLVRLDPRSIAEVPYVFVGRAAGESKMGMLEALRYGNQLVSLYALMAGRGFRRPAHRVITPILADLAGPSAAPASGTTRL